MQIRPFLRADLLRVLEISVACFSSDELFSWMYPHQEKYPNDLRRFQLVRLRSRLVQQGSQGFVAETESGCACSGCDGLDGGRIVGFGFFVREGDDVAGRKWRAESLGTKVERWLVSWDQWYEVKFLQRASDPEAVRKFAAQLDAHSFDEVLGAYWHLELLAVDPKCQRKGIGLMTLRHGLDTAAEEKLPVLLEASPMGKGLYQKIGFKTIRTEGSGAGDAAVAKTGIPMLWEPPGLVGTWFQDDGTLMKVSS